MTTCLARRTTGIRGPSIWRAHRVTLDRDGNIVLAYKPNNEEGHKRLAVKLRELMKQQRACPIHGKDYALRVGDHLLARMT